MRRKLEPNDERIELIENAAAFALLAKVPGRVDQAFLLSQVNIAYRIGFSDGVSEAERRERQEQYAKDDARRKTGGRSK